MFDTNLDNENMTWPEPLQNLTLTDLGILMVGGWCAVALAGACAFGYVVRWLTRG